MSSPSHYKTDTMSSTNQQAEQQHDDASWCLSIKTVGGGFDDCVTTLSSSGERLFTVTVSPNANISTLYQEIEGATGVKASQQRLIYRGRIINDDHNANETAAAEKTAATGEETNIINNKASSGNPDAKLPANDVVDGRKIKDIAGLCDGQTIHLVKRRRDTAVDAAAGGETAAANRGSTTESNRSSTLGSTRNSDNATRGSIDASGGAFLAALLGLGGLTDDLGSGGATTGLGGGAAAATPSTTTGNSGTPSSWRTSRNRSSRRPHYRLAAADLEVPDPGSMEPVRQGLMTLHTLLPHADLHSQQGASPLEANREWFRGQWLDVRDTVNQWLEATVVEVLSPSYILSEHDIPDTAPPPFQRRRPATVDDDPAVHANDYEGRRRLLLEPCEVGDPNELGGDLIGYRPRSNNDGVQLLLVHYNGWPHRWDEWIRSDSERIRPFRTRTRHPNSSSTASPTPLSVFSDAPNTAIRGGVEELDRTALLPELNRALSQVNSLLGEIVQREQAVEADTTCESVDPSPRAHPDLPWMAPTVPYDNEEGYSDDEDYITAEMAEVENGSNIVVPRDPEEVEEDNFEDNGPPETSETSAANDPPFGPSPRPVYSQRELRNLATVLDRLGRTLTDAAPHVASLAASLPEETIPAPNELNSSASAIDAVSTPAESSNAPLGGLLSLWSRERRRQNSTAEDTNATVNATQTLDPDHVDYASGLVNTTRGEVRSGPRSRSSQDDVANLLGAYLAAASLGGLGSSDDDNSDGAASGLGRLLARGGGSGGTGPGIDIHIHAVVTTASPGAVGAGGTTIDLGSGGGLGPLGGGGTGGQTGPLGGGNPARNLFSSGRSSRGGSSLLRSRNSNTPSNHAVANDEEENDDLFSDLYSENPTPVDPNGSPTSADGQTAPDTSLRNVGSADASSRGGSEGRRVSFDESSSSMTRNRRSSSVPRRNNSGRRSSGVFRIFRRRSRSSRNGPQDNDQP